ncbi:MAG: hypothetical protein KDA22_16650 [Phycisphaerales bacterium]|nr:hypothetical protein [Phycisphaerales bacterium]
MSARPESPTSPTPDINPDWEVSPQEVRTRLDRGEKLFLLDVRTDQEVDLARIDGSFHLPMHDLHLRLDDLREHEARPMVVYCHRGRRSLLVTAALRRAGFEDVRSMAGGIEQWARTIDPRVPLY